jgi:hypothetical protein
VRRHVPAFFALADAAWTAEGDAKPTKKGEVVAKPLRKAFQRKYHLVVNTMFNAAKGGRVFTEAADLVSYAVTCDPDLDYAKVAKRLASIRAQLESFAKDFPVSGLSDCADFLKDITEKDLKTAREQPQAAPVEPVEPVASEPDIDADQLLDEALGNLVELKAA